MTVGRSSLVGLFLLGIIVIALPLTVLFSQQQQKIEQHAASQQFQPFGPSGNWNMIFDDEFNGTSLDTSKWYSELNQGCYQGQGQLGAYIPQNVIEGGGELRLRATHTPSTCSGQTFNYSQSIIQTGGQNQTLGSSTKFKFKYGYMETRAKMPTGPGFWLGFWTLSAVTLNWPPEIDSFEIYTIRPTELVMTYHGVGCDTNSWQIYNGPDFTQGFHTFGTDWEPNAITWYLDGKAVRTYTNTSCIYNNYQYILANMQIGGGNAGQPNNAYFPADYELDYIRVWQKCTTNCTLPSLTPVPTKTPILTNPAGGTTFTTTICPHGLGNCGDNANPTSTGNTNPKHPQLAVTLTFLNSQNQPVGTAQGTVSYSSTAGNFQGTLPGNLPNGQYLVREQTDGFLPKQLPGIITIIASQPMTLPSVSLVAGDINHDGQLDILDYNLLVSCFGSKQNTSSCSNPPTIQSQGADLNDDGIVNGADYNLFLRELSVQRGG